MKISKSDQRKLPKIVNDLSIIPEQLTNNRRSYELNAELRYKLSKISTLRHMTKFIPFACGITIEGTCLDQPETKNGRNTCCCSSCYNSFGHFNREVMREQDFGYYLRKFSASTGFWRKGKGCTLPRKRRSNTCVFYMCSNVRDKMPNSDVSHIDVLSSLAEQLTSQIRTVVQGALENRFRNLTPKGSWIDIFNMQDRLDKETCKL